MDNNIKILFRLDAGKLAGLGHLSRNLALAEAFIEKSLKCTFLIKSDDKRGVSHFLKNYCTTEFDAIFLSFNLSNEEDLKTIINQYNKGFSFLILDHYQHNEAYQLFLKENGVKWAQFDYKKKERIFANVLINPNIGTTPKDYIELVDSKTKLCVGEKHSIIRKEFLETKREPIKNRILISMGGGTYPKEVIDMIGAVVKEKEYHFDIVGGGSIILKNFGSFTNTTVYRNPVNISKVFAGAHAAIVAGGVTTYELAYLGVPMIIVPFADNQRNNAIAFQQKKLGVSFNDPVDFRKEIERASLISILEKLNRVYLDSKKIDGKGAKRILKIINLEFLQ